MLFRKYTQKNFLVSGVLLSMLAPSFLLAGQFYEETAEGIIGKLQEEPAQVQPVNQGSFSTPGKVRLRSFPGSESAPATSEPTVKLRTLKRLQEGFSGEPVMEVISVPEEIQQPHVNLKIEFDVNSYAIRPDSFQVLAELGKALSSDKLQNKSFVINGHTDADGSEEHNLQLSYNRARSVKYFLTSNYKVPTDRLLVTGYGESMPTAENNNYAGKQMNRRVEVVVK